MICWHRWSRWETKNAYNILSADGQLQGTTLVQKRRCPKCGMVEMNTQTAWLV